MKLLYKVTSRQRPDNLKRTLLNIQAMAVNPDYLICLTLDENDYTVNNPEFKEWINQNFFIEMHSFYGKSRNKIDAINRDLEHFTHWDILVNVSDDQVFTVKGFDKTIEDAFMFKGDTDLFLHFRDTNHDPIDALCTLSIIGQDYFKRDGYVYHPSYKSVWCDNEAMQVAKNRNCYRFIPDVIFDHLHPAYGKAQADQLSRKTESPSLHKIDHNNFLRRQKLNFPK
jgi:hypothetical protein